MNTKIITIVIVVVLVAGGTAWYVIERPAQETQTPDSSPQPIQGTTPTTVSTSPQPSAPKQTLDLTKTYSGLFSQFGATTVNFARVSSITDKKYGSVYALYTDAVKQSKAFVPHAEDFSIGVSLMDLSGDGLDDALVYDNLPGACGSGGCPLDVYRKKGGEWVLILSVLTGKDIGVSDSTTGGFKNLLIPTRGTPSKVIEYRWSANTYKPSQTIATWQGDSLISN